jgi:hypothetical protein
MEELQFKTYDLDSSVLKDEYTILQAGNGKKDDASIKIDAKAFSFIEGLIWDKYREYGNEDKTKIDKSEWDRIIAGFENAVTKLDNYENTDNLMKILKFGIIGSKHEIIDVTDSIEDLKQLLMELVTWLSTRIKKNKYIYVIK